MIFGKNDCDCTIQQMPVYFDYVSYILFVVCHIKAPLENWHMYCILPNAPYMKSKGYRVWCGQLHNKLGINTLAGTLIFGMCLAARFHQEVATINIILYPTGQNYSLHS